MVISRLTTKNRRPKQNIGNFSSCKMETSFRYNSLLQKDFMYWLEFDTDVLSYDTPGIVVNYQSNGKEKSHTPDFQVVRYQKKQIIEVKSQNSQFADLKKGKGIKALEGKEESNCGKLSK